MRTFRGVWKVWYQMKSTYVLIPDIGSSSDELLADFLRLIAVDNGRDQVQVDYLPNLPNL